MNKKILITGAEGFTGVHACHWFKQQGYTVYPLGRQPKNQKTIQCDLLLAKRVEELVGTIQPDYILHLAGRNDAKSSWGQPVNYIETNVIASLNILEAVRQHIPEAKVLMIGSALEKSTEDLPLHPYGLSKTIQALMVKAWAAMYNVKVMLAKPTNLIGPGPSNGICALLAKEITSSLEVDQPIECHVNNIQARRDFIDVRDAVRAYEMILTKGDVGKEYQISSGQSRSLKEVIEGYQELTKKPIHVIFDKCEEESPIHMDMTDINALGWEADIDFMKSLDDILTYHISVKRGES
ncbi:NAD-dependent epimerase/dehydratase family protein [Scopulibacillus cellulosilyticus]|uniref:NAD-dependent epimerase/dehydratase family protein n=1 Tax=Scopulibacillus cellulosilyticus TaxID=2665665 RepID=A0ABW2PYX7_9BACL